MYTDTRDGTDKQRQRGYKTAAKWLNGRTSDTTTRDGGKTQICARNIDRPAATSQQQPARAKATTTAPESGGACSLSVCFTPCGEQCVRVRAWLVHRMRSRYNLRQRMRDRRANVLSRLSLEFEWVRYMHYWEHSSKKWKLVLYVGEQHSISFVVEGYGDDCEGSKNKYKVNNRSRWT